MSEYITIKELELILKHMKHFGASTVDLHFGEQCGIGRNLEISLPYTFGDHDEKINATVYLDITTESDW